MQVNAQSAVRLGGVRGHSRKARSPAPLRDDDSWGLKYLAPLWSVVGAEAGRVRGWRARRVGDTIDAPQGKGGAHWRACDLRG